MTSKIIQFQNGLKGLKKRNLNIKSKKWQRESKESKTSHTHKSKRNYKRNAGEWHSYISGFIILINLTIFLLTVVRRGLLRGEGDETTFGIVSSLIFWIWIVITPKRKMLDISWGEGFVKTSNQIHNDEYMNQSEVIEVVFHTI